MQNKLPINVNELLKNRTIESERIEYKTDWNPESMMHTLCAFANDFHTLGSGYTSLAWQKKTAGLYCHLWAYRLKKLIKF